MAGTDNATYTREQVAAANTPEKLWIVLHGKGMLNRFPTKEPTDDHSL